MRDNLRKNGLGNLEVKPLPQEVEGQIKPVKKLIGIYSLDSLESGMLACDIDRVTTNKHLKEQQAELREIEMHKFTKQIASNTSYLPEMVGVIRDGNEINEDIVELYIEMMNVMKASTKEEAESVIKEVVGKAKDTKDAIETMSSLINYGKILLKLSFQGNGVE